MHRLSLNILVALVTLTALTSCGSGSKFDREKWSYGDGLQFPLRDGIVEDLMKNHHIKGLTFDQIIDSLGSPQRRDSLKFTYQLTDNSYDFAEKDPIRKKNLIVYFNKDSVAVKFEIYDHTEKEKKKK